LYICEYRIYPSYKVDTGEIEMTKACIENFNTNFSKGVKFEIFAGGMGYDEKKKNTNCYCCDVGNLYIHYEPNSLF